MAHHWDKSGAPGQIPGHAAHVEATSRATKYMKTGGYIGIGLGGVVCVAAIVGAGAWVGTTIGGLAGEAIGDNLYEVAQP